MFKQVFFVVILLISQVNTFSQNQIASKFARNITGAALKRHLTVIAGEKMEGRETGTEGQRMAASYIEEAFKKIGLSAPAKATGFQQMYPVFKDSLISSQLQVNGQKAIFGTDFICTVGNNENVTLKNSELIFVGYGIEDSLYSDYSGLNVTNKIVVFFSGEPKKDGRYYLGNNESFGSWTRGGLNKKIELARTHGALGVFYINTSLPAFMNTGDKYRKNSNLSYPPSINESKHINYATLSFDFSHKIMGNNFDSLLQIAKSNQEFKHGQYPELNSVVNFEFKKQRDTIYASNVIGIIEGAEKKDEYLYLTAHYDHLGKQNGLIYPGADDDGSGTCAVIEMANAFQKAVKAGFRPKRTIVFMTVSGEEKGLWGSEYYTDHPYFSMDKTTADLNTDMVGRIDPGRKVGDSMNYVYVIGHDKLSSDLPVIIEGVNRKNDSLELDYKFDDPKDTERIYYRSDHYNFARKGVPVLFFFDGIHNDYHKPSDTVEKINWDLYQKRVRLIFSTAWEIANRPEMLIRDIALPK